MLPIGDDNSARRTLPVITYLLITLNFLVFFVELTRGDAFIETWSFVPAAYQANHLFGWVTIFTSMFMHAGWLHILGNMLYLWIFGDNVEDALGHFRFLLFYLLCGIAATFAQYALDPTSQVGSLGASGAIAGVLAAYLVLFPRQRVRVWVAIFIIIPLPAILVIGLWFFLQIYSQLGGSAGDVAYMAHIGGFITGLILVLLLRRRSRPPQLPYS